MLDPHLLRKNIEAVSQALAKRGFVLDTAQLQSLEYRRKGIQVATERLQAERNRQSKEIGRAKSCGGGHRTLLEQVASPGDELKSRHAELEEIQEELHEFLREVPNTLMRACLPAPGKRITRRSGAGGN